MPTPEYHLKCEVCGDAFTARRSDATACKSACRVTRHRRRQTAAAELLSRQTSAIRDGADEATLTALAREAERLLGRR